MIGETKKAIQKTFCTAFYFSVTALKCQNRTGYTVALIPFGHALGETSVPDIHNAGFYGLRFGISVDIVVPCRSQFNTFKAREVPVFNRTFCGIKFYSGDRCFAIVIAGK